MRLLGTQWGHNYDLETLIPFLRGDARERVLGQFCGGGGPARLGWRSFDLNHLHRSPLTEEQQKC